MKYQLFNPSRGQFEFVDGGQLGVETLLLNILMELRVHSVYLQAQNPQVADDLNNLRLDVVNDPLSFTPTSL
jgi:hypothetical protein